MGVDTLVTKLASLVIDKKKLVTYKSACSFLDVDCKQSKVVLKTLLNERPHLEATWLVSGIEKDSKILKYWFATTDKLITTKSRFLKVNEEHIYSLRMKPEEDTKEQWNCTEDISEAHYKTDLNVMQNVWLDRQNLMSDQILLDHRYSAVRGLDIERTAVARSNNLCSPTRKKRTKSGDVKGKPFSQKSGLSLKRESTKTDLPPKKRAKTNSLGAMFSKAKPKEKSQKPAPEKIKRKLIFGTTTKPKTIVDTTLKISQEEKKSDADMRQKLDNENKSKESVSSKLKNKIATPPQKPEVLETSKLQLKVTKQKIEHKKPTKKKKTGIMSFFSTTSNANPFDREKSSKVSIKRSFKKVNKKTSTKKKAVKKKSYQATSKPKRRAPEKKAPLEDVSMFADEESDDDEQAWNQQQMEQEKEEEEEFEMYQEVMKNRKKPKKSVLRDSDSESEAEKKEEISQVSSKPGAFDSPSEDEKPVKVSAKERRALRKAEEEKRKQELLAFRKSSFWGAAKGKVKAKKKKTKVRTRNYIDPVTQMLVTEEIEETDQEAEEVSG